MESRELFRRLVAARPDDPLWRVLSARCRNLIKVVVYSRLADRRLVDIPNLDDLTQDVMERLLADRRRVIRSFAGEREGTFEVFIRRIAENIFRDQFRRDAYRRQVEESFPADETWRVEAAQAENPIEDAGDDPEAAVRLREMHERVESVVQRISLDERQQALNRLLFQLYFEDRYTITQIARLRAVPLSASSVSRRIRLMRQMLRMSFSGRHHRLEQWPAPLRGRLTRPRGSS